MKPKYVRCTEVLLEKKVSDIIPDIVISLNGRKCLVEIAVTHFVDQEKVQKIAQIGLPLLEIDLSNFYNFDISKTTIRQAVLSELDNRKWIYNPKEAEAKLWAKEEYELRLQAIRQEVAEQQKRYEARLEQKERKREHAARLLQEQLTPTVYKSRLLVLRNDQIAKQSLSQRRFFRECSNEIPFFVDIPITGEIIFPCDRRIWQSAVFDKFIYNRKKSSDAVTVSIKRINAWLKDHQSEIPIAWDLASRANVQLSDTHSKNVTLFYDVIAKYIDYLSKLGFVSSIIYSEAIVKASHTIIPPNEKTAIQLCAILNTVNCFDPDIDFIVESMLSPKQEGDYWIDYFDSATREKQAEQRALQDKIRTQTRELGKQQVVNMDFDSCNPIYDTSGYRWLLCTSCDQILREDEMSSYGGRGKVNKGICRSCSHK